VVISDQYPSLSGLLTTPSFAVSAQTADGSTPEWNNVAMTLPTKIAGHGMPVVVWLPCLENNGLSRSIAKRHG
jgi:hypothetical protein